MNGFFHTLGEGKTARSSDLLHAARMDAVRANQGALDRPVKFSPHPFKVGPPRPFRLIVGMADVVTDRAPFLAD